MMNAKNKAAGILSLPAAAVSVALIAGVIAMAWESGIPDGRHLTVRIMLISAIITGAAATWFGAHGFREKALKTVSMTGAVTGCLCVLAATVILKSIPG